MVSSREDAQDSEFCSFLEEFKNMYILRQNWFLLCTKYTFIQYFRVCGRNQF